MLLLRAGMGSNTASNSKAEEAKLIMITPRCPGLVDYSKAIKIQRQLGTRDPPLNSSLTTGSSQTSEVGWSKSLPWHPSNTR